MRFLDIRNALVQSWISGDFGLPWAKPGKDFDPETGAPWARVHVLPAQPGVATLGDTGRDYGLERPRRRDCRGRR